MSWNPRIAKRIQRRHADAPLFVLGSLKSKGRGIGN
jgi:hypothetical protein